MASNFKNINSYLGAAKEEEKDWEDKALEYASSALEKAEPVLKVLGYPGGLVRGAIAGRLEAATGRDDLVDIKDVLKGEAPSSSEIMEKLGVKEMGSLSDAFPELYSETGKGLPLQKGGMFDPTTRGALGFAGDIVTDPLTYLAGAGVAAKGAEAASESKPVFRKLKEVLSDERGSFDTSPKPTLTEVMPGMYSKAEQLITDKMGGKATPEQILGVLREAKPEEVEFLKIREFLEGKDKVTKEELLQHIKENLPQIEKKTIKDNPLQREYQDLQLERDRMDDRIQNNAQDVVDLLPDYNEKVFRKFHDSLIDVNSPEWQEAKQEILDQILKGKSFDEYKAKLAVKENLQQAFNELKLSKSDDFYKTAYKIRKEILKKLYPNYMDIPREERQLLRRQFDAKFQPNYYDESIDKGRILGHNYFPPEFDEFLPKNFKELVKESYKTEEELNDINTQIKRIEWELPSNIPSSLEEFEELEKKLNDSFQNLENASLIKQRNNKRLTQILEQNPNILLEEAPKYPREKPLPISSNYEETIYNLKPPFVMEDSWESTTNRQGLTQKGKKIYEDFKAKEKELEDLYDSGNYQEKSKAEIFDEIIKLKNKVNAELAPEIIKKFPSHFDDFTLTHRRGNSFKDAEGRKHLLVQEIQSDIHQQGRIHGYADPKISSAEVQNSLDNLLVKEDEYTRTLSELRDEFTAAKENPKMTIGEFDIIRSQYQKQMRSLNEELIKVRQEIQELEQIENKPFNAPIKDWQDFQGKQLLLDAAKGDFDNISWTAGEDQARWHHKLIDGIYEIEAKQTGTGTYELKAYDAEGKLIKQSENLPFFKPEALANIVGKDAALELLEKGKVISKSQYSPLKINYDNTAIMYDRYLPKFFEKFGKKFGVVPEKVNIGDTSKKMWTFKMTPQMRQEILKKGFPLFMLPFLNQPEEQEKPKFNKIRKSLNSKPL
jgi:hypothetical protein